MAATLDLVSFRPLTIRPQHLLSSVKHKHLTAHATNRENSSAGFCSPKSSRRRVSPPARASPRRRWVSACHHASCGLLGSSTECREDHRSATCSQHVTIEAVGREDYNTATSRNDDQRAPSTFRPEWKCDTDSEESDRHERKCVNERGFA